MGDAREAGWTWGALDHVQVREGAVEHVIRVVYQKQTSVLIALCDLDKAADALLELRHPPRVKEEWRRGAP